MKNPRISLFVKSVDLVDSYLQDLMREGVTLPWWRMYASATWEKLDRLRFRVYCESYRAGGAVALNYFEYLIAAEKYKNDFMEEDKTRHKKEVEKFQNRTLEEIKKLINEHTKSECSSDFDRTSPR